MLLNKFFFLCLYPTPIDPPTYDPLFSFLFLIIFFSLFFSSTHFFTNIHFLHILYLVSSTLLSSFFFYAFYFPPRTHIFKEPTLSNFSSFLLPANWKALRVNFSQFHPRPTPLSLCSPKTKLELKLDGCIGATPCHLDPMVLEDSNLMLEWDQWWSDGGLCPYLDVAMIFSICHFYVFCGYRVGINLEVHNKAEGNLEIKNTFFFSILDSRAFWSSYKMIWLSPFKLTHI